MGNDIRIGGFQECSFCDYPNKTASVIFMQGCNLRCRYCYNRALLAMESEDTKTGDWLLEKLKLIKGKVSGIVLTGGEPLCQGVDNVCDVFEYARYFGFFTKLDTNGMFPERLNDLIKKKVHVDYIAIDLKAGSDKLYKELCGQNASLANVLESISIVKKSGIPFELRTTVIDGFHTDKEMEKVFALAMDSTLYLQPFKRMGEAEKCSDDWTEPSVNRIRSLVKLASDFDCICLER